MIYVTGWPELEGGAPFLAQNTVDFTAATSLPSGYTYSRGTAAMMEKTDGTWVSYGANDPLLVAGKGLFCPGAYINYSKSTSFEGRAAGVIGSGGKVANGWDFAGGTNGVVTVTGGGIENGLPYTTATLVNNSPVNGYQLFCYHSNMTIAGTAGDKFTEILPFSITGTHPSQPPATTARLLTAYVTGATGNIVYRTIDAIPYQKASASSVTCGAPSGGTFFLAGTLIEYRETLTAPINATYRIYSPNFVNLSFAPAGGSMLVPNATTSASVSNAALCTRDLSWLSVPYSVCVEFRTMDDVTTARRILTIGADASNRSLDLYVDDGEFGVICTKEGSTTYSGSYGAAAPNKVYRVAVTVTNGRIAGSINGGAVVLDGTGSNDTVAPTSMRLGYYWGNILHGFCFIRKLVGPVPGTWTDAQLQAMSAL